MASFQITTLFGETPSARRSPSAVLVSMVMHVAIAALVSFGLKHSVRVKDEGAVQRYTLRMVSLWPPQPKILNPALSKVTERSSKGGGQNSAAGRPAASEDGAAGRRGPEQVASSDQPATPLTAEDLRQPVHGPQTLVQPDLPPNLLLPKQVPIPFVLVWSPESSSMRVILPPPPQERTANNTRPDLTPPNHELTVEDLKLSATVFATDNPVPLPSTTSPIVVHGPEPTKQVVETTARPMGTPASARVMSLSNLTLERGTIALPLVNETAALSPSGARAPASAVNSSPEGKGNGITGTGFGATGTPADHAGIAPGETASGKSNTGTGNGDLATGKGDPGAGSGKTAGSQSGSELASDNGGAQAVVPDAGAQPVMTRIVLPKDGKFGVVVVGASMAEEYPETAGLWGSRLAYTVYLHVGSGKSWILQYSLPRDRAAASNGEVARVEAPWPFVMERPEFAPGDLTGDPIMVHGFVNESGRFEKLSIVIPDGFAQTKFLLNALEQWQFRAAIQKGLLTTVEVLLIIPSQGE